MSSGRTDRHRLHCGGDRQANSALWRIALVRMGCHQPTKDYVARRTADGKTKTEIMRCLKRYIARGSPRPASQRARRSLQPAQPGRSGLQRSALSAAVAYQTLTRLDHQLAVVSREGFNKDALKDGGPGQSAICSPGSTAPTSPESSQRCSNSNKTRASSAVRVTVTSLTLRGY